MASNILRKQLFARNASARMCAEVPTKAISRLNFEAPPYPRPASTASMMSRGGFDQARQIPRSASTAAMISRFGFEQEAARHMPWTQIAHPNPPTVKPTLCDLASGCWMYSPAVLKRASIEPGQICASRAAQVKCKLWKRHGFLHCHADGSSEALVLPVYMADGCGFPSLSSVLKRWMESNSSRWTQIWQYLASAANAADLERNLQDLAPTDTPSGGCWIPEDRHGKRLDTRFDTDLAAELQDWLFVIRVEKASKM